MYTVKKLAELSGVSVRTLHHYDEIGLLPPAYHGANGYRFYGEEEVLRLQQILFLRELGFKLKRIAMLLGRSDFDQRAALRAHRGVLEREIERLRVLITTIDKTNKHLDGEGEMTHAEMYWGFSKETQEGYEKELRERLGKKAEPFFEESKRRTANWGADEWKEVRAEGNAFNAQFAEAIEQGLEPDSEEVQAAVERHYNWIKRFYTPTKEVYEGLAQMYVEDDRFRQFYSQYHPQMADFVAEAMKVWADKRLS